MADIFIRGMEMPTEEEISKCIIIRYDGEVWIVEFDNLVEGGFVACYPTNPMRAVPLLEWHGRLIDGDALYEVAKTRSMGIYGPCDFQCVITGNDILKAHTIVPAEGGRGES